VAIHSALGLVDVSGRFPGRVVDCFDPGVEVHEALSLVERKQNAQ
jgi:hypothetical protein